MTLGIVSAQLVNTSDDAIDIDVIWLCRLNVWLVVDGQVVDDVRVWVVAAVHALDS